LGDNAGEVFGGAALASNLCFFVFAPLALFRGQPAFTVRGERLLCGVTNSWSSDLSCEPACLFSRENAQKTQKKVEGNEW
jgi:hypothetical protein